MSAVQNHRFMSAAAAPNDKYAKTKLVDNVLVITLDTPNSKVNKLIHLIVS